MKKNGNNQGCLLVLLVFGGLFIYCMVNAPQEKKRGKPQPTRPAIRSEYKHVAPRVENQAEYDQRIEEKWKQGKATAEELEKHSATQRAAEILNEYR